MSGLLNIWPIVVIVVIGLVVFLVVKGIENEKRKEEEEKKRGVEKEKEEAFRIEVEKKKSDDIFTFKDLKISHLNCLGGDVCFEDIEGDSEKIVCQRCKNWELIHQEEIVEIIKTAIDGKERFTYYDHKFFVVRKKDM